MFLSELHIDMSRYKKNDFIVVVTKQNDGILLPFAHSVKFEDARFELNLHKLRFGAVVY